MMKFNPFKRYREIVCVFSGYQSLQYMLLSTAKMEDILFVSVFTPNDCYKKLIPKVFRYHSGNNYINSLLLSIIAVYFRVYNFVYPKTKVYISGLSRLSPFVCLFEDCFNNIFYLEEGAGSYTRMKEDYFGSKKTNRFKRFFRGNNFHPAYSNKIDKIYLTGILPIPKEMQSKVELISLEDLWNKKTEEEKQFINDFFLLPELNLGMLNSYSILLLTQPLYIDVPRFSDMSQIELYRNMLKDYEEKKVVIKVHPRDKIDYKIYFPEAYILDICCPMELLILNKCVSFQTVLTFDSTAIYSFDESVNKVIAGLDIS